jgi:hypothetical protein
MNFVQDTLSKELPSDLMLQHMLVWRKYLKLTMCCCCCCCCLPQQVYAYAYRYFDYRFPHIVTIQYSSDDAIWSHVHPFCVPDHIACVFYAENDCMWPTSDPPGTKTDDAVCYYYRYYCCPPLWWWRDCTTSGSSLSCHSTVEDRFFFCRHSRRLTKSSVIRRGGHCFYRYSPSLQKVERGKHIRVPIFVTLVFPLCTSPPSFARLINK